LTTKIFFCYNTTKNKRSQGLKVYKTAKLEILGSHIIEPTIRIYREALSFIIDVCYKEKAGWLTLGGKNRCAFIEKLVHITSDNPNPKYIEFDKKFYKIPSYLRRAIINQAVGIVNGDIATFTTGKIYHADLNASYNIAARYFLRELERAKVPVRIDRTSQTLDTLINLAMMPHHPSKVA